MKRAFVLTVRAKIKQVQVRGFPMTTARTAIRTFLCASAMVLAFSGLAAQAQTPIDPLEAKVAGIRDRFVAAVRACGVEPTFEPDVELATDARVISYDPQRRAVIIGRYEALPPPFQGFLGAWAAHDMPGSAPEALFDKLFNGFLVAHELGHWVGDQSGRMATVDVYAFEIEANRFAIAFAALDPETMAAREETVGQFSYIRTLPNPVPEGQTARQYFNDNYATLTTQDPLAYNWYQGQFMELAWEQREDADFCDLARLGPERPTP